MVYSTYMVHTTHPTTLLGNVGINMRMNIRQGDTVRQIRTGIGYSQADLAKKLGVSKGTIERIEKAEKDGSNKPSNYEVYILACKYIRHLWREVSE